MWSVMIVLPPHRTIRITQLFMSYWPSFQHQTLSIGCCGSSGRMCQMLVSGAGKHKQSKLPICICLAFVFVPCYQSRTTQVPDSLNLGTATITAAGTGRKVMQASAKMQRVTHTIWQGGSSRSAFSWWCTSLSE